MNFTVVDRKGKKLKPDKVKVRELPESSTRERVYFKPDESNIVYHLGCGMGNEVVSIVYKGAEMKIHFRFFGEYGAAFGKITFQTGDFIATPGARDDRGTIREIIMRKATAEELK
ncbi:MAG: hypothetical protein LUM44_06395 [Pyrinomonadaceae bacterium]|nr:hypothetical protein [Pyrinomonadaceae bacterium]